mgnify:CR=1 FL=1
MYEIKTRNKNVKKELEGYISIRPVIKDKLQRLMQNPRKECSAHPLRGRLAGKWACWLGSNIRMVYEIDDSEKIVMVEAVGSHNIY